jgi:hypothetical protein
LGLVDDEGVYFGRSEVRSALWLRSQIAASRAKPDEIGKPPKCFTSRDYSPGYPWIPREG